jgi:hypothetical protein
MNSLRNHCKIYLIIILLKDGYDDFIEVIKVQIQDSVFLHLEFNFFFSILLKFHYLINLARFEVF